MIFNMSEIDNSSQDLPSRVTVLENELENLQNNLTQISIHNKNLQNVLKIGQAFNKLYKSI